MRPFSPLAFVVVLALTPLRTTTELTVSEPESKLWVEGTSSIKSFKCSVPDFALVVTADGAAPVAAVLNAEKVVKTVTLTLPAAKIDCGSGTMNDHMKEAVKATEDPTIVFKLSAYDISKATAGVDGTVHGSLTIGGVEKPIDVTGSATDAGNGGMHIVGSYEVALSAFSLKAPSLMFGTIKVGDKVQVKFDLVLKN